MDGPIRVLHAVVNMNRGGAETFIMNLYRNMDRSRIQFDFLTCKPGVFDQEIRDLGGTIHRVPYISKVGPYKYQRLLKDFSLNHPEYDILHSHLDKMSGLVCRAAKKSGLPIRIAHSHNTESEGNRFIQLYKWYSGTHIRKSATHYAACSMKAAIWMFGEYAQMASIIKNGVEGQSFLFSEDRRISARKTLGLAEDTLIIGHVGRFHIQKNHAYLIEVFAKVLQSYPEAKLVLVGDGPLRKRIEGLVNQKGLGESVLFLGIREDIPDLLQAFDLMLFPSFHEGLPVTIIEAQAAGVPCILSDQITHEVDLGIHLIRYARLAETEEWLDKIHYFVKKDNQRGNYVGILAEKGYDIRLTALWMNSYYSNLVNLVDKEGRNHVVRSS